MSDEPSRLARVGVQVTAAESATEKIARDARSGEERRRASAAEGVRALTPLLKELLNRVTAEAGPAAHPIAGRTAVTLGQGSLSYDVAFPYLEARAFPRSRLDALAGAFVRVGQTGNRRYPGRSANLWYADLDRSGSFRWWEVSYMAISPSYYRPAPFGIAGNSDLGIADEAASVAMGVYQYAQKPALMEREAREGFFKRWMDFLATAATASLETPRYLPEA